MLIPCCTPATAARIAFCVAFDSELTHSTKRARKLLSLSAGRPLVIGAALLATVMPGTGVASWLSCPAITFDVGPATSA